MKDANAQQEDVTGLFRKFGGDAAAYKEFAPSAIPADTRPSAPAEPAEPPAPPSALHRATPAPSSIPVLPRVVAPAVEALPVAANEVSATPLAPRELDRLFARLDACAPAPAPAARGLMAHWRKPG
ncbi:hypothetical protein ACSFA0_06060 [Variovorax sp. LT1P1]|uniref:hypothetical protein n=1 Tax=Variovorax sp. LT1P1 TaxID=3443730 RepID=UPI003F487571